MRAASLLFLRVSIGFLIVFWGLDKLVNVAHGLAVSEGFYLGLFSSARLLNVFGVLQILAGGLVVVGMWRRFAYPAVALMNLASLLVVWKSVVDPWGWWLEQTNVLFYPSLIIFAATLVLWAFLRDDEISLDRRLGRSSATGAASPPAVR